MIIVCLYNMFYRLYSINTNTCRRVNIRRYLQYKIDRSSLEKLPKSFIQHILDKCNSLDKKSFSVLYVNITLFIANMGTKQVIWNTILCLATCKTDLDVHAGARWKIINIYVCPLYIRQRYNMNCLKN
jgi:hypothetical protein